MKKVEWQEKMLMTQEFAQPYFSFAMSVKNAQKQVRYEQSRTY